jgi:hypothetical protein
LNARPSSEPVLSAIIARQLVSLACRAPSVHNTQPWTWRIDPGGISLYADASRQLSLADPDGRNLMISCGAALHHLQVAALARGWSASVSRLPDPADPTLLADVRLSPVNRPAGAVDDVRALKERCTDRRRFTSWPVPDEGLVRLATIASVWGGQGVALTDVAERFQVELLVARAMHLQAHDVAVTEEQEHNRFGPDALGDPADDVQGGDGLVVLCATDDTPLARLQTGEGLSALWLHAVREGLSVVPLSQVIDVPETRAALQHGVLGGLVVPMLLVRVGWQAISRSQLETTPRRAVDEVLLP